MIFELLLPLNGAPYFNAVFNEPFHNERGLVLFTAQAVKHEHEQDIKFFHGGVFLDLQDSVTILSRNLEA